MYSYVTKMLNTEKSDGALYVVHKVFANASEYYSIEASVKKEEALASVKSAVDSFKILGNSSLKEAAPGTVAPAGNKPLVIQPDGNGNWVDFDGNTYSFANDQDVYTEDGTSYYWHGEAADVYYMPVQ